MISGDNLMFPGNVVEAVVPVLQTIDSDLVILKRPLRSSDPTQCIGVFGQQWIPDPDSMELVGRNAGSEATIGRYSIPVHALVKHTDETLGLATHTALSKLVRTVLYRSTGLAISLRALSVTLLGSTEKLTRYGISAQRFMSNEVSGQWLYLSVTEFWIETETH